MYDKPFYITEKVSNNAFNYEKRINPKLYVPQLKDGTVDDVEIEYETVFEDYDDDGVLHTCKGLRNFIKAKFGHVPAYIFDNHNHAFPFWCQEFQNGNLQNNALVVHIDQHKDTRIPSEYISKEDAQDLQKVFHYTNTVLNVGNFIPAAQHIGLVKDIIFLDSEYSLNDMQERLQKHAQGKLFGEGGLLHFPNQSLILDIDLDFFAPDSDYIGNDFKLKIIDQLIPKSAVITFAFSPYFIDQQLALNYLKKIMKRLS